MHPNNPSLRAFIVEDIPANRINLTLLLSQYCSQVEVVGHAESVDESFRLISELQPDLLFIDIAIRGGTGFDLLASLQEAGLLNAEILFLTGEGRYEYATRAFEYSAIDFLDKPVDPQKLCRAVERAYARVDKQQYAEQIRLLMDQLRNPEPDGRLALHLPRGGVEVVTIANIIRCEADGVITHFFRQDQPKITAVRNLGHYRELLVKDYNFFTIDHSEIVNLDYVTRYTPHNRAVTLTDGTVRTASRRYGQELNHYLKQHPLPKRPVTFRHGFWEWVRGQLRLG